MKPKLIIETLIELLEFQEQINVKYEIEEQKND